VRKALTAERNLTRQEPGPRRLRGRFPGPSACPVPTLARPALSSLKRGELLVHSLSAPSVAKRCSMVSASSSPRAAARASCWFTSLRMPRSWPRRCSDPARWCVRICVSALARRARAISTSLVDASGPLPQLVQRCLSDSPPACWSYCVLKPSASLLKSCAAKALRGQSSGPFSTCQLGALLPIVGFSRCPGSAVRQLLVAIDAATCVLTCRAGFHRGSTD